MTWLAIVGVLVAALLLAWISYAGKQPVVHRPLTQDLVRALLDALLYRGVDETRLTFRASSGDSATLVFAKYVRGPNGPGLRAALIRGAADHVEAVREEMTRRSIPFAESEASSDTPTLLRWEFGRDVGLASLVLYVVFERAGGLNLERVGEAAFNEHLLPTEVPRLTGMARLQ
jgi:hypothetical protein